jgi:hypothetical protein
MKLNQIRTLLSRFLFLMPELFLEFVRGTGALFPDSVWLSTSRTHRVASDIMKRVTRCGVCNWNEPSDVRVSE